MIDGPLPDNRPLTAAEIHWLMADDVGKEDGLGCFWVSIFEGRTIEDLIYAYPYSVLKCASDKLSDHQFRIAAGEVPWAGHHFSPDRYRQQMVGICTVKIT